MERDGLLAGTTFRLEGRIGEGGMGQIYQARCDLSGEQVALKLLRAELVFQPEMIDRMRLEGEALAIVRHVNVVGWRSHGITAAGTPFVAMERVQGRSLHHELRLRASRAMSVPQAVSHVRQLLAALEAVHAAGIVHRDIKPGNLLVARSRTGRSQIKLLDFGVAKVTPGARGVRPLTIPTQEGACVGTPRYASPEQILSGKVDARADVYAAGILLYRLLAGRGPFDHLRGIGALLRAHLEVEPAPPSRFSDRVIPEELERVIARAIAKHPDDRHHSAAAFDRELARFMGRLASPADRSRRRAVEAPARDARLPVAGRALSGPDRGNAHARRTERKSPRAASSGVERAALRSTSTPANVHGRTTVVRARFDLMATAVRGAVQSDRGAHGRRPRAGAARSPRKPRSLPGPARPLLSSAAVAVTAAAFAAVTSGVALWFVR